MYFLKSDSKMEVFRLTGTASRNLVRFIWFFFYRYFEIDLFQKNIYITMLRILYVDQKSGWKLLKFKDETTRIT